MSDAAYTAVQEYLGLGRSLLNDDPLVSMQNREEVIEYLAGWRARSCAKSLVWPGGFHLHQLDFVQLQALEWGAPSDQIAWRACEIIAADFLDAGLSLPKPLQAFTAKLLRREIERPSIPATFKNQVRNEVIAGAVNIALLADPGLRKTRNEASFTSVCACDIVADCLKEYGINIVPDAVRKIHDRH